MDKFGCTGCGICCRIAGKAVDVARILVTEGPVSAYTQEVADFPFGYSADGVCEMLGADNKCSVYESRPDICRVDRAWERFHRHEMTREQYFKESARICNDLMRAAGLPSDQFVPV